MAVVCNDVGVSWPVDSIDERRDLELAGLGVNFGVDNDHLDTSRHDARRVPVTRPSFSCRCTEQLPVGAGRLRMAGKASESFPAAWYPPSSICWEGKAKSSLASEQMASWLSGYSCGVQHDRPLQGCSAELGHGYRPTFSFTGNNCSSHLGGPGEPWGATRDPRGGYIRGPDGPDNDRRARRHFPAREKG